MSFKKNKYQVIKGAISKELANFCYQYFLNKRAVARHMFDDKYISQYTNYFGVWNDEMIPETYSHYGDIAMDTLLQTVKPVMEKETDIKLTRQGFTLVPDFASTAFMVQGETLQAMLAD